MFTRTRTRLLRPLVGLAAVFALGATGAVAALDRSPAPRSSLTTRSAASRRAGRVAGLAPAMRAGVERVATSRPVAPAVLLALLERGLRSEARVTIDMGEIFGIAAPGSGTILREHIAYDNDRHLEASGIDVTTGPLAPDASAAVSLSMQTLVVGHLAYVRPTTTGAKWTEEIPPSSSVPSASAFAKALVDTATAGSIHRISPAAGESRYRFEVRVSDLATLRSLSGPLPPKAIASLSSRERRLLSGEVIQLQLVITLDRRDRITSLVAAGVKTESRADAAARKSFYPIGGTESTVILRLVYAYGGSLRIATPSAAQIANPGKPLR